MKRPTKPREISQDFPKAEDVCKIIGACREAGVSLFRMGHLEVYFGVPFLPPPPDGEPYHGVAPTPAAQVPVETIRAQQSAEEAISLEEQEIEAKERRIAELLLTDPLQAEEMMRDGDLEASGEPDGSSLDGIIDEGDE